VQSSLGTVEKAIDVLFHLHAESAACGVTAIGRALDMPKSSVHRLLSALARRGLVERDERGRYRPGVGLVALGLGVLEREPAVIAARPVLERFAHEVGETFFLVAARAGALVVLDKAEGTGFLRAAPRVGARVPVHATAVGKLYLALEPRALGAPASRRSAKRPGASDAAAEADAAAPHLRPAAREAFTDHTLTDPEALGREIEAVRRTGIARNSGEWIPGLSVLAAPVRLGDRLVAAVALALATSSLEARSVDDLEDRVREAAATITARLSGATAAPERRVAVGPPAATGGA